MNVILCRTYAGISSRINGGTHIPVNDIAIMRSIPEMYVADPADGTELEQLLPAAAETEHPCYIRMPKGPLKNIFSEGISFSWGKGGQLTEDADITLISTGIITPEALEATEILKQHKIAVRLIHIPSIKPIDAELVLKSAKESRYIVTAENHSIIGGLGSAVLETISEESPRRLYRLGIEDVFCEGITESELKKRHGINASSIANTIIKLENQH